MKYVLLIGLGFLLSSCTIMDYTKEELTGCDHHSKWCDQIRDTAAETYLYAQMSANTYNDAYQFKLPINYELVTKKDNDDIGFAYSIYENTHNDQTIIVFRGTEGANFKDWWYGNLWGSQNDRGLELFDTIREEIGSDETIILTGHSLGGGIALEISLKRENVEAYVFNTSPRFSADGYSIENKRVSVVEHGEILKALRAPSREASQTYTSIGCSSGGPVAQHEQAKLAECLTQIAATESNEARRSLAQNNIEYLYE